MFILTSIIFVMLLGTKKLKVGFVVFDGLSDAI
jgi:hypothetical protein